MLASTVQFSSYRRSHHHMPRNQDTGRRAAPPNNQPPCEVRCPGAQQCAPHHPRPPTTTGVREVVINVPPMSNQPHTSGMALALSHTPQTWHTGKMLLRKEVIQPHLPVRLPCYDFVPIANPTFDSSPHKG